MRTSQREQVRHRRTEEAFQPLRVHAGVDYTNICPLQATNEHLKHTLRSNHEVLLHVAKWHFNGRWRLCLINASQDGEEFKNNSLNDWSTAAPSQPECNYNIHRVANCLDSYLIWQLFDLDGVEEGVYVIFGEGEEGGREGIFHPAKINM